jgi:hypothetical protein
MEYIIKYYKYINKIQSGGDNILYNNVDRQIYDAMRYKKYEGSAPPLRGSPPPIGKAGPVRNSPPPANRGTPPPMGSLSLTSAKPVAKPKTRPEGVPPIEYINEDFELYTPQGAGYADYIWPFITGYYNKYKKKLHIRSIKNKANDFEIIPHHLGDKTEPILGNGTFTAVYEVKDIKRSISTSSYGNDIYILRLYLRDYKNPKENMFLNAKIIKEYELFNNYLSKVYFLGSLYEPNNKKPIFDQDLKMTEKSLSPLDLSIVKKYNTEFKKLTDKQKYTFLINNLKMLEFLQSNKYFHADYKIGNIAYDNEDDLNVILIDYDINTLQLLSSKNPMFEFDNNIVKKIKFSITPKFTPKYIDIDSEGNTNDIDLKYWDKYSIGGLINIIKELKIEFIFKTYKVKVDDPLYDYISKELNLDDPEQLISDLNLDASDYDKIPTYTRLLSIFDRLKWWVKSEY